MLARFFMEHSVLARCISVVNCVMYMLCDILKVLYVHSATALPKYNKWLDGQASGVPVSGPRSRQEGHLARRHLHNRPVTPLELPGTDWGGDPPPPPPTGNEREREYNKQQTSKTISRPCILCAAPHCHWLSSTRCSLPGHRRGLESVAWVEVWLWLAC